jgi:Periplasmic binding protein
MMRARRPRASFSRSTQRATVAVLASAALCGTLLVAETPASSSSTVLSTNTVLSNNGEWPGVGKICEHGAGGLATGRGVTSRAIDIAGFNDANNTVQPGLDIELLQAGQAFAAWCNASGGIDGRRIVVQDRDGGLFNDAQVTNEACQADFMAVGGGLVLDQPTVPIRVGCGLGEITQFIVSDQAAKAPLQVSPANGSLTEWEGGFFGALAKKYPQAIKHFGDGSPNTPSVIAPITKWKDTALAQGYKLVDWQLPPLQVTDWGPYIQELESKGVQALEPANYSNMVPYMQAMATAGYKPTFILMPTALYLQSTKAAAAADPDLPPTYLAVGNWPFELASESPGLEHLIAIMKKYAPSGAKLDFDDELSMDAWILFAKSASACGADLTVSCVLKNAASQKNWTGGGLAPPVAHLGLSDSHPAPSDCYAIMDVKPNKFVYDKSLTDPNTDTIWHCDPKTLFKVPADA